MFFISLFNNEKVFASHKKNNLQLTLTSNQMHYSLNLDYTTTSNIHTIIWQASKFSRMSKNENKAKRILNFFEATNNIENSFEMVFPGIKTEIDKIEKQINTKSVNAKLKLNGAFQVIKEKNGLVLDREKLYFDILEKLKTENDNLSVEIPTKIIEAKFKEEDLKKSTNLRSSFTTDYSKSSPERKNNIQKAISSFNGMNIYPGETISFNKTTGSRTAKNGYQEAKIILGGEYIQGFGGGVCQASTTIYNACLTSGLECKARCHSIPPSYISKGLDAMVNSGSSDMTITNNLSFPIYIEAYCTNEKIVCNIYGENLNGYSYKTKVEINEILPDKGYKKIIDTKNEYADKVLYTDESFVKQKATQGFKTTTYLQTFKDNKFIKQEKIRSDYYPASEGIIIYGNKERPPQEITFFDEFII